MSIAQRWSEERIPEKLAEEVSAHLQEAKEEGHMLKLGSHKDVIELLESYREAAANNYFSGIGIVMVGMRRIAAIDWAGDINVEPSLQEGFDRIQERIKKSISEWSFPPQDESLDLSWVRYNITTGPLCFDFITWLVRAEMNRRKAGAPGPLKVGFWMSPDPEKWLMAQGYRRQKWLDQVFRPALNFIGAVEDDRAVYGHHEETYVQKKMVDDFEAGVPVRLLQAPPGGVEGAVTITLREKQSVDGRNYITGEIFRNSNIDGWIRFGEMLQKRGEQVIIIRDTAKADEPVAGFKTSPIASRDLTVRMSLYGAAKMNWFVGNGPAILCHFSELPWTQFLTVDGATRLSSAEGLKSIFGIEVGEQFPWSKDNQRITWAPDTYDNIMSAWEAQMVGSNIKEASDGSQNR